ncbi:MAG: hypothetical protein VXW22_16160, partial [Pseudomonadota bacterium]|nr:hypothetical protein [Pseudomonadota bacterium]
MAEKNQDTSDTLDSGTSAFGAANRHFSGEAPRRHFVSTVEKLFYFVALIVGSAIILLGKANGLLSAWQTTIFAVALITGYFLLAIFHNSTNTVRADRLGDNCYYLGFVFTLASLIATLIQVDAGSDITGLIGNFGIALVSTAAGIIGRLILIQLRSE